MSLRPSSTASAPTSAFAWAPKAALLALCVVAGCQAGAKNISATPPAAEIPDLSAYRLGIGDRVRVSVFGEPELSVDADVNASGQISYPLLGSVPALKKTSPELEADIARGLAGGYLVNPDVRVTVLQYRPFYVIGQVNRAGAYPYSVGLTVEKAIAVAGGLTRLASIRGIYLLREDASTNQRQRVGLDATVLPGDTVLIEESLF